MKHPLARGAATLWPWLIGPWLAALLGAAILAGGNWSEPAGPWLLIASAAVLGMPHGAGDWLLAPRTWWRRARWLGLYTLAILAAAGVAAALPRTAVAAFGGLALWHFGAADQRDLDLAFATRRPQRRRALAGAGRTTLLLAGVFVVQPLPAMDVANRVILMLGGEAVAAGPSTVRLTAAAMLGAGLLVWASATAPDYRRAGHRRLLLVDGLEAAVLAVLAATLAPLAAVGLYFLTWHSFRHTARLAALGRSAPVCLRPAALARVHLRAAPLLLPVLPVYVGLVAWRGDLARPTDWAVALILLFVVLTPPHHAVVERTLR